MTTTTLRLPPDMAEAVKLEATERGTTMNELIRSLIGAYLKQKDEQRLYDGFTLLGSDREESNVEYAIHAATEVVLKDE
jgi:hypothetical protein